MAYVWAASRSCNAVKSACGKATRVVHAGERRINTVASLQQHLFFASGCDFSSIPNHHMKCGMPDNSWIRVNYSTVNAGIEPESSGDDDTNLSESLQIRCFLTPLITEVDDGG